MRQRLSQRAKSVDELIALVEREGGTQADCVAADGAALARAAGWKAEPLTPRCNSGEGYELARLGEERGASVLVVGSRGLSGVRAVLGSTSDVLVHVGTLPVLVVPHCRRPCGAHDRGVALSRPVGIVALFAGMRALPESYDRDAPRTLDVTGLLISGAGLFALTYALLRANTSGWTSPLILGLFACAGLAAVAFAVIERRVEAPAIDLSLFRVPAFSGANVAVLVFNLGTFGVFLYTSLFFQDVLGYSPVSAGAALLPWILMLLVVGPFTGRLAERATPRLLIAGGLVVMGVGLLLLADIDEHSSYRDLLPGLLLGGLGGALTIPLSGVAVGAAPVEKSGVASGIFSTAREAGGSLGIAVIGAVLSGHGAAGRSLHAFAAGYARGVAVAAILAIVAAAVVLVTLRARASDATAGSAVATAMPVGEAV